MEVQFSKIEVYMGESAMLRNKVVSLGMKDLTIIEVFLNSKTFKKNLSFTNGCSYLRFLHI